MFDYPGLNTLAAVIRHGSFDAAAKALNLTQSAVSQRIRALEERTGSVLVQRGVPSTPTDTGLRLFRHYEEVSRLESEVARDLGQAPGRAHSVRIAANADSLATWLVPALAAADGYLFEIVVDDQDHSAEFMRKGEVAAAITAHGEPIQGCDTFALGALRYLAAASPAFVDRWLPDGPNTTSLASAPALVFDEKDRLHHAWIDRIAGHGLTPPRHRLPSTSAFLEAALRGLGWGMIAEPMVRDHIARGRLTTLLPDAPLDTPLFWQVSRVGRGTLEPLTRAVRRAARAQLVQPS